VHSSPTANDLVAINLQYEAGTEALNVRALGQLLAKLLYVAGALVSKEPKVLAKEAANVLGIRGISLDLVGKSLQFLGSLRLAKESHGRWLLTPEARSMIAHDVERASLRIQGVLSRHFPQRISAPELASWFNDACVQFYAIYGSQWAAALGRQAPVSFLTRDTVHGLLGAAIARHSLESETDMLVAGFHSFLASDHPQDVEHNWSLCQALLASRLVAANVGPDPVTAREFSGARLFLDTNMLLIPALEADRLGAPLKQLGTVLRKMGAELCYIEETRDEYTRIVAHRKNDVLRAFERFPENVLRDSTDSFVETALKRRCRTQADIEKLFGDLLDPPEHLGNDVPLSLMNDEKVVALAKKGSADNKLKKEISGLWWQRRGRKKQMRAAEHDAALTAVAEGLSNEGIRCSVLTLDRTMHEHALARAGRHSLPQWISLDALIQILAVEGAGPDLDPSDFAPLMASIIRHQCEPMMDTYRAEDLSLMLDVEDRCAALPVDQVKEIAVTIARERLKGRKRNDPELVLIVRRAFQSGKFKLADDAALMKQRLQEREGDIRSRDKQIASEQERSLKAIGTAVEMRKSNLRSLAMRRGITRLFVGIAVIVIWSLAAWAITRHYSPDPGLNYVSLFATLLSPDLGILAWLLQSVIPEWRHAVSTAGERAHEEIKAELESGK
jgi:hypothetical protein